MNSTSSARFLEQITHITHMERGKLSVMRETSKGCCYKLQTWEDGKNVSRYVVPDQAEAIQQAIDGYHKFQELTQQYAKAVIDQTRAELAANSKKSPPIFAGNPPRPRPRNPAIDGPVPGR
jgi:hypothetical protein